MRSSTVGAVLVFVVSGGALGVVTWREQREEAARRAEIEARDRRILEAAQASARAAEDAERRRFLAMTDAEHLEAAHAAVAADRGDEARRHLSAVSRDAGAAAERLLADLARREQRTQRAAERASARAEREAAATRRSEMAAEIDRALLRSHHEVRSVRADGTVLRVNYVLCGRSFLTTELQPLSNELRAAGFTRIECSTGYGERAWLDL